ncbi:nLPC/P60 domain-containing protein [Firmicutes bacterium CAG:534]|mgnify:FL=1|nr:nLPC/P60 domain-containing protein [Firmicutes bacterium CAG:534]
MRKGKGLLRLIAVGMSWSMLLAAPIPVFATSTKVSELEKQKEELEQQKKDADAKKKQEQQNYQNASGKVSSIQSDVDAISDEIDEIDESLVETIASVEIIRDEVSQKEDQIKTTTEELQKAQETEQEQYAAMKLRVKFMYEKGDSTYLQLLLESQNFGEMVNKVEYVEKLYDYDRKLLEEYIAARQAVEALKNQLEDEKAELEAQQHELEEEQKSLEEILTEKKATYDNYEVQLAQAKQEAAVYKANIKKQNDEIKRLEAASAAKQSEIDAAKQAEEEARRAQELALQKQAESSGTGEGQQTSSSGSSSASYASASSYSGSGSKGQQIANYACQFIGNPYVPGGTSLTEGADCSGFVWRVYKDFGYSVPRTSYSLRSYGTGVSYSEAQPGDVVCYAGHVGIYIGNGQIVHASTQRTGIKITTATYKEILSVRRIV